MSVYLLISFWITKVGLWKTNRIHTVFHTYQRKFAEFSSLKVCLDTAVRDGKVCVHAIAVQLL